MKDMLEQIYDELNAQVIRMMEHGRKQAERIAELERENSSLAYELNVALSGGTIAKPTNDVKADFKSAMNPTSDGYGGFTSEFMDQYFGWKAAVAFYGLKAQ